MSKIKQTAGRDFLGILHQILLILMMISYLGKIGTINILI